MVKDHYAKLGFISSEEEAVWFLDVAAPEPTATMKISRAPATTIELPAQPQTEASALSV
jgi:hypothetical protein